MIKIERGLIFMIKLHANAQLRGIAYYVLKYLLCVKYHAWCNTISRR